QRKSATNELPNVSRVCWSAGLVILLSTRPRSQFAINVKPLVTNRFPCVFLRFLLGVQRDPFSHFRLAKQPNYVLCQSVRVANLREQPGAFMLNQILHAFGTSRDHRSARSKCLDD